MLCGILHANPIPAENQSFTGSSWASRAVLGDFAGETSPPDEQKPPRWIRPLSLRPFWSLEGTGGLTLTLPLDL
jgi:hypothetical protein